MVGTRIVVATAAALACAGLLPQGALAGGGGAVFEFDSTYYVPGEIVTAETTFSNRVANSGRVEDGPYYAYLLPSDQWIHPPEIPEASVPLGPITITDLGRSLSTARITFIVPKRDPGPYTLALCNQPCRQATVGDLMGGWISIVPTKDEAIRRELADQFERRLSRVRERLAARIERTEKSLSGFAAGQDLQELTRRVNELVEGLALIQKEQRSTAPVAEAAPWVLAGIVLVGVGLFSIRRQSRRRPRTSPKRLSRGEDLSLPAPPAYPEELPRVADPSGRDFDPAHL